nr:sulfurtransferase TusA family protein [Mesorhizobium sp.]
MRGLKCPVPVVRTRKAVRRLDPGTVIRVDCTDPLAEIDIPHMVRTDGHILISKGRDEDIFWYVIKLRDDI